MKKQILEEVKQGKYSHNELQKLHEKFGYDLLLADEIFLNRCERDLEVLA